jgi:trehalose synthase
MKTTGQPFQFVTAVGGVPEQIIHKHTGLLAHSAEGTAYQIRFLLSHPEVGRRLGEQGHQHVRENFLITGNLRRYLTLFVRYVLSASPGGDVQAA